MTARKTIWLLPLDSTVWGSLMLPGLPRNLEPVALACIDSFKVPDAILVRVKSTGKLAAWRQGALAAVDQRQVQEQLDALPDAEPADEKAELADALKTWRAAADMTQARAAEVLGMSKRSYEGIEAGRGFVYPRLLLLALMAFNGPDHAATSGSHVQDTEASGM